MLRSALGSAHAASVASQSSERELRAKYHAAEAAAQEARHAEQRLVLEVHAATPDRRAQLNQLAAAEAQIRANCAVQAATFEREALDKGRDYAQKTYQNRSESTLPLSVAKDAEIGRLTAQIDSLQARFAAVPNGTSSSLGSSRQADAGVSLEAVLEDALRQVPPPHKGQIRAGVAAGARPPR